MGLYRLKVDVDILSAVMNYLEDVLRSVSLSSEQKEIVTVKFPSVSALCSFSGGAVVGI